MGSESFRRAMEEIAAAELAPRLAVRALRLLLCANPDDGHLTLSWPAALTAFGVEHPGSVRRALGELQAARIVHYSTAEQVYVDFCAWKGRNGSGTRITRIGRMRRMVWGKRMGERENGSVGEGEPRVGAQEMACGRTDLEEPDQEIAEAGEKCAQDEAKPRVGAQESKCGVAPDAEAPGLKHANEWMQKALGKPWRSGLGATMPADSQGDEKPRVDAQEMARGRADLAGVIKAETGPSETCTRDDEKPRADAQESARERAVLVGVIEAETGPSETCAQGEEKPRVDALEVARGCADASRAYACARDRLIDINVYPDPIDRSSTNRIQIDGSSINQSGRPRPSPAEVAANRRLLADPEVRVGSPAAVTTLAEGFPFEELLRHVFAWKAGRLREPGALVYRCRRSLEDPSQFQPPPLGADERASDLYRRHAGAMGENGRAGEWESGRIPAGGCALGEEEEERVGGWENGGEGKEEDGEEEWGLWQSCLRDLRCRMARGTFEWLLEGSRAVREGGRLRVRVRTPEVAEWLDKRMRPVVESAVKAVTGERMEVVFVGEGRQVDKETRKQGDKGRMGNGRMGERGNQRMSGSANERTGGGAGDPFLTYTHIIAQPRAKKYGQLAVFFAQFSWYSVLRERPC